MEQKCPKCNSNHIVGPATFNEEIVEYLDSFCEMFKPRWKLRYKRKIMCIDCGNIFETTETTEINIHQLAQMYEREKNKVPTTTYIC